MPAIQPDEPLVFRVDGPDDISAGDLASITTTVRALEGMQKEAVVRIGKHGPRWRMVSDEGPYLNGTDLAPFPLAFFTAGTQFSLLSGIVRTAREHGVEMDRLELSQDNYYSMNGSFLRGDATGGAATPEVSVRIRSEAPVDEVRKTVELAAHAHEANAILSDPLENTFALELNERQLSLDDLRASTRDLEKNPIASFEALRKAPEGSFLPEIIRKGAVAEAIQDVEGGAGSSLKAEQKRTLHVHGEARVVEGLQMETRIHLLKPIGSTFLFKSDEPRAFGGGGSAPPPLAYVSAGTGFCYMTQLGRYAHIVKQQLSSYIIVQQNGFRVTGQATDWNLASSASPFDTHVFITSDQSEDEARKLVRMGEQTCFLHAAMRARLQTAVKVELNGTELS